MLEVKIPDTKEKIIKQILALEGLLEKDTNKKDMEIHQEALHWLRKALEKIEK